MNNKYTFGYEKDGNRTISVSAESDKIGRSAAELLMKSIKRSARDQDLVKGLTEAAVRWQKQSDSFIWKGADAQELRKFYKEKADNCIKEAARIIVEGRG